MGESTVRMSRKRRHDSGDHSECETKCPVAKAEWMRLRNLGKRKAVAELLEACGLDPADWMDDYAEIADTPVVPDRLQRIQAELEVQRLLAEASRAD